MEAAAESRWIILALAFLLPAASTWADSLTNHMNAVTVRVLCLPAEGEPESGSGFVVGGGSHVVTNRHVVSCTATEFQVPLGPRLLDSFQHPHQNVVPSTHVDLTQLSRQSAFVDATDLIEQDPRGASIEIDFRPAAERLSFRGERSDDHARQGSIHVVRRHDQRRARFLDFGSDGRIEIDPIHLAALNPSVLAYHCQSPLSASTGRSAQASGSSSAR
ncbi:hypothetical protein Atep_04210 [Allochromatium tepidum]|uniref:Serine protease n=1 Tax=Allochromatium tepidum TaxID=553982 RepID=A0ABM7QJ38_9GAMM|nr:hypothetical protein Atep_04210 [Allochromatium tepidum]